MCTTDGNRITPLPAVLQCLAVPAVQLLLCLVRAARYVLTLCFSVSVACQLAGISACGMICSLSILSMNHITRLVECSRCSAQSVAAPQLQCHWCRAFPQPLFGGCIAGALSSRVLSTTQHHNVS